MNSLMNAAQVEGKERPLSLKTFMGEYDAGSLRALLLGVQIHQGMAQSVALPENLELKIEDANGAYKLTVLSKVDSTEASVEIPKDRVLNGKGENKSDDAIKEIAKEVYRYLLRNLDKIKGGELKAAHVGGAIYGIAAGVILFIYNPLAKVVNLGEFVDKAVNSAFAVVSTNVGEYYGAIVDDVVAMLKREDNPTVTAVAGTLSALFFTVAVFGVAGGPLRFLGIDGWSFTRKIGEEVGGLLKDAVNEIEVITGIEISDIPGDVADAISDLF